MTDGSLELVRGAYDAFGRGEIEGVFAILAEDVDWTVPEVLPQGGHYAGKQDVAAFFERLGSLWEGLSLDIEDFVASGDRVCVIGRASGGRDGERTGYGWVHVWTVRDGAAVRFAEYADPAPELLK